MASKIKFLVFKGSENEDPDQFWFMVKAVWEAQGATDDNINKATLVSALQDHALTCSINHSNDNINVGIMDIQDMLNREFSKQKLKTQWIIGFKEIDASRRYPLRIGSETQGHDSQSQHDLDGCAAPHKVCSIKKTTSKDDVVAEKVIQPSRSFGDCNESA